ncbi:alpha/beta fold hydrolase [Oceanobacillus jeddahense]|uniref:Alpha/beta hydrolase n=1 Tax=Oceanobacillus jeddahense TaxID=1462527 RepID=A0ABY5JVJ9_9BACI|nr:alpha/beta hydrolase [Oceanobacillus jeddahense]UUI03477.1 alpha/beta hydrolase [Oceanobacillus jeddahense]
MVMKNNTNAYRSNQSLNSNPYFENLYNIDGRRLLLNKAGSGGPAVVFLPAAGMVGLDYLNIHHSISEHTTSVIYDRAGTGWSEQVKLPRSAQEVTGELRHLLNHAGIPAPYLFVGHSLGGLYAQRYAQCFPNEVAGMVLLEPVHEDYLTRTPKFKKRYLFSQSVAVLRTFLTYKRSFRGLYEHMFSKWPDAVREPLIEYHTRTFLKMNAEKKNLNTQLYRELRTGGDLPDVPLIVFTAMETDAMTSLVTSQSFLHEITEPFNHVKKTIYKNLANSVSYGEHRILENAGHASIHIDCPDEVVKAILDLLDKRVA